MKKKRSVTKAFKEIYARTRIFLANGQTFFNDFKYPVFLAVALKVYFPNATILFMAFLTLLFLFILFIVGWIDLKFIHIAQRQAEIQTRDYNPYFKRLEKKI